MVAYYCSLVTLSLRRFLRYSTGKYTATLKPGLGVTQGHRNRHGSIRHLRLHILTFHSNYGTISYRFRDKRRFPSKIANFPTPVYFAPPLTGFPLELDISLRGQKLQWWDYRAEQEVSRYLKPCGYNPQTWQTDGRTDRQTDRHRATAKTALTHSVAW